MAVGVDPVTVLALAPSTRDPSWENVLGAAVKPQFAVERYVALPGDVLFGPAECAVDACSYPARRAGRLCLAHAGPVPQEQRHRA